MKADLLKKLEDPSFELDMDYKDENGTPSKGEVQSVTLQPKEGMTNTALLSVVILNENNSKGVEIVRTCSVPEGNSFDPKAVKCLWDLENASGLIEENGLNFSMATDIV